VATRQDVIINVIADTKKAIGGMAAFAVGIGTAIIAARKLVKIGTDMVNAFGEQEQAEAKLAAAVRATGREHEISVERMGKLASSLQKVTTFGDEATLSAMAMTQQLSNLSQEGLENVTPGILDFAAAMDVDLNTAATLVGKTLGSTTNALTRYGVEVDMSGTKAEKLASITQALNDKFGGTAEALAETTLGGMAQFQNAVGDLKEAGGEMLAEFLSPTIKRLTDLITAANEARQATKEFRDAHKTGGAATEEELMGISVEKFRQYKTELEETIEIASRFLLEADIGTTLVAIAQAEGLSLTLVKDIAVTMGVVTEEALLQNEAFARMAQGQAVFASKNKEFNRYQEASRKDAERRAELIIAETEASKLIAQYSADFFPQEPLTRIEETAEALAVIQEKINSVALLGGDLSELGALRNALRELLGELKLAEEMGDPADLPFAPLLGLGPAGQVGQMNGVTMAMKLQGEVMSGVAEIMKDPALMDLPLILQGDGTVDLEYFKNQFTELSGAIGGKYVPAVKEAIEVDQFWGAIALNSTGPAINTLVDEADALEWAIENLGDSLKKVFGNETLEMLEGFGAAMMGGADGAEMAAQSVKDFAKGILDNLPTLLFQAGLMAFSAGLPELGAGLLVASGIAAIVKGAVGVVEERQSSDDGGVSSKSITVNNVNIGGSMITEKGLTDSLLSTAFSNTRGY